MFLNFRLNRLLHKNLVYVANYSLTVLKWSVLIRGFLLYLYIFILCSFYFIQELYGCFTLLN